MSLGTSELTLLHQHFQQNDPTSSGLVSRSVLCEALLELGCAGAQRLLELSGFGARDQVNYDGFLEWLVQDDAGPSTPKRGMPKVVEDGSLSPEKELRSTGGDAQPEVPAAEKAPSSDANPKPRSNPLGFREQAALVVERGSRPGELVDDLQEVNIMDLENVSAMSCWRSCHGLRLYRSRTVTEALRLICSAPVPGLGGVSYLEVFETLTHSGWEHHIFLFGGLVRDILRRKVGNDIDVTFSAPAAELEQICHRQGYKCHLDGDYILIGDGDGDEYLEGMVVTHNGVTPPENSDFSMNWVFYDFCNDVIIDKTGRAVQAVIANRCEIPCPRDTWDRWVAIGGSRLFFRYFKFLIRGYEYDDKEMSYIAEKLLNFWAQSPEETVENGREVLNALIASKDSGKIERLRQLVFISYAMATNRQTKRHSLMRQRSIDLGGTSRMMPDSGSFLCASSWWHKGWLPMLNHH